jgi:protein O-GlcNAc transferase
MNSRPPIAPTPVRPASAALDPLLADCHMALALHREFPTDAEITARLRQSRREAASAIVLLGRAGAEAGDERAVQELLRAAAADGAYDLPVTEGDLSLANQLADSGALGLLAAMLLVPAWRWSGAPALRNVFRGHWPAYTAWLFHAPAGFSALGEAEAYSAHCLRRLEELALVAASRPTAVHVRAAVAAFVDVSNSRPLHFSADALRRHMELRGQLLTSHWAVDHAGARPAQPRNGRRLRVGFIHNHLAKPSEVAAALPFFGRLDPARFEVCLFARCYCDTPFEQAVRDRVELFTVLPQGTAEQLKVLRGAALDVLVFGGDIVSRCHEVSRLALHRIAPLQVAGEACPTTTGLPEIDLYVAGSAEAGDVRDQFSERLALLRGPGLAFDRELDQRLPQCSWSRAELGVHPDSLLFVSAAPHYLIGPEVRATWARLLATNPGSRLCLHPFDGHGATAHAIQCFTAECQHALSAEGVAFDRLILSTRRLASRSDLGGLLQLADVYLDTFPVAGATGLVDALEYGLPVVTIEGRVPRVRTGAALVRSLGLDELVAADSGAYRVIARRLARDHVYRFQVRQQVNAAMDRHPVFLDSAATSAAFGRLLELAHDELLRHGPIAFRADPAALVAGEAEPSYVSAAWLDGLEPPLAVSA